MTTFAITDSKMWSLGKLRDHKANHLVLGRWLSYRLATGLDGMACEVRDPSHTWAMGKNVTARGRYTRGTNVADRWHKDGSDYNDGQKFYLICAASILSTEILGADGTIYQAEPFEVLMFDNLALDHRTPYVPRGVNIKDRWFWRARANMDAKVKDVPGVYALEMQ